MPESSDPPHRIRCHCLWGRNKHNIITFVFSHPIASDLTQWLCHRTRVSGLERIIEEQEMRLSPVYSPRANVRFLPGPSLAMGCALLFQHISDSASWKDDPRSQDFLIRSMMRRWLDWYSRFCLFPEIFMRVSAGRRFVWNGGFLEDFIKTGRSLSV